MGKRSKARAFRSLKTRANKSAHATSATIRHSPVAAGHLSMRTGEYGDERGVVV